ncbi:hypothetical protein EMCG_06221 [[Emmonsia] crescens]|uniref:Uncharacterized protein n=1 Tax=[Emmonsia] crescens TaxID=73230 RepID=A0A0G2JBU9_9EURO|nr:hypothetical protein EMCG_06221 [Emmonsia crescens UAMH 3008]
MAIMEEVHSVLGSRERREASYHVASSGTNFIFQELHKFVPLNPKQDERGYVTLKHFRNLLQQLWQMTGMSFRVSNLLKFCMYSSARVGEYIESTARQHSGRGLYVPEVAAFSNLVARASAEGSPGA